MSNTNLLDIDKVASVYSGKANKCCCGCSGKYYYAKKFQEWSSKNRGYPVNDEDVNDRQVKRIVNKLNKNIEKLESDSNWFCLTEGNRWYIAYYGEAT